jgi:hypothetical protein
MAQTLKFGNGTWATKKGSTLAYSDTNNSFKPLPFTYTGAGKGTRVNKEGLIEVVENDRPRIDYKDSEDGVFLLEKAATNLYPYSNDTSTWVKSSVNVTKDYAISPDGTQNAFRAAFSSSTGSLYINALGTTGVNNTLSVWAKSNNGSSNKFRFFGNGYISISDDYIATEEWQRFEFTYSCTNVTSGLTNASDSATNDILFYGFQHEVNSHATSYIPTQGTSQTRVQETASGSGNSEVFNSEQGVLFANIAANADDLTQRALGLSDGTSSNRMSIVYNDGSSNALRMFVSNPSGTKSYITNSFNITQNNKISIKLNGTSLAFWVNGFEIHTDTLNSAFVNGTLDTFDFAFFDNNTPFYGKTKEIGYYDAILTDLELETLTSYRTWEAMVKELNLNIIHNE